MSVKVDKDVKVNTDPCLLAWADDQLFVGCEDGTIKTFNASLESGASWPAHDVQLFALAAGGGKVYSSSNDGGVKVWSPAGDKVRELEGPGADIGCLRVFHERLYAGDEAGGVSVYEQDQQIAKYNVLEEVKDILVCTPFMMTVRDLDLTVTEISPESSKVRFSTRHTMEGRAPVVQAANKLILTARDGKSIRLHENSIDSKYRMLHEQKASEMILTSLAVGNNGAVAWSGGWDGKIRRWEVGDSAISVAGDVDLGACVNALVTSQEDDVVYAAVAGGRIVKVKFA